MNKIHALIILVLFSTLGLRAMEKNKQIVDEEIAKSFKDLSFNQTVFRALTGNLRVPGSEASLSVESLSASDFWNAHVLGRTQFCFGKYRYSIQTAIKINDNYPEVRKRCNQQFVNQENNLNDIIKNYLVNFKIIFEKDLIEQGGKFDLLAFTKGIFELTPKNLVVEEMIMLYDKEFTSHYKKVLNDNFLKRHLTATVILSSLSGAFIWNYAGPYVTRITCGIINVFRNNPPVKA